MMRVPCIYSLLLWKIPTGDSAGEGARDSMEEIFRAGNGLDVDEPHTRINGPTVGDVVVADHAHLRRVVQLQILFHGDLEAARVGFRGNVGDDADALERLETVLHGVGVDGYAQTGGDHLCNMVPDRFGKLTSVMRPQRAVGIQ